MLEDAQTGEETTAPIAEIEPCPPNCRCGAGRV
jgi:hypothetical protein